MHQLLAKQMHRPKQMRRQTAHTPLHPAEARRQLQAALMVGMSMQATPVPALQLKIWYRQCVAFDYHQNQRLLDWKTSRKLAHKGSIQYAWFKQC